MERNLSSWYCCRLVLYCSTWIFLYFISSWPVHFVQFSQKLFDSSLIHQHVPNEIKRSDLGCYSNFRLRVSFMTMMSGRPRAAVTSAVQIQLCDLGPGLTMELNKHDETPKFQICQEWFGPIIRPDPRGSVPPRSLKPTWATALSHFFQFRKHVWQNTLHDAVSSTWTNAAQRQRKWNAAETEQWPWKEARHHIAVVGDTTSPFNPHFISEPFRKRGDQ